MIRWKISRVGWAYAVASLAAVAGLVIESWQSDAADVETQVLADLSTWGFAGEFVLAGMGLRPSPSGWRQQKRRRARRRRPDNSGQLNDGRSVQWV